MKMKIVGFDPGKHGFAVISNNTTSKFSACEFEFDATNLLNLEKLKSFLAKYQPDVAIIEKIQGRGGWGATQNFSFGFVYGQIISAVRAYQIPIQFMTPVAWQGIICKGIKKEGIKQKERTLIAYRNLFPSSPLPEKKDKINDNLLDAFMISIAGHIKFGNEVSFKDMKEQL
jgi:Holliday junction resolvasome RuvABC endonuclease subunit